MGPGVNLVVIVILYRGRCGLSKCITRYLVAMAAADLMVVFFAVILEQINKMYFLFSFLFITPICSLSLVMTVAALDCSVWLTVTFTFDRFITICCQKLKRKYCTERTATVVIIIVFLVSFVRSIPFYFAIDPYIIIDDVQWYCTGKAEYFTSTAWKAYELVDSIITPLLPILLIMLFNALTVRDIIVANRARRRLWNIIDNHNDPDSANRRKSMILLFTVSANFILLWMTYVVHSLNWQVQNFYYRDKYLNNPIYIAQQFGFMLQLLSSCTNTCIYGLTQRKFREELSNGVKYLFTLNGKLCKYQTTGSNLSHN
ncbi:probable G-protein coupled receptor 139 [Heterodontus francisci]|uniref:probable G-protein coupled receptor 139 n=1 Tax=Heterodontus francisci TaxID=7792 RepID=UPI00355B51AC